MTVLYVGNVVYLKVFHLSLLRLDRLHLWPADARDRSGLGCASMIDWWQPSQIGLKWKRLWNNLKPPTKSSWHVTTDSRSTQDAIIEIQQLTWSVAISSFKVQCCHPEVVRCARPASKNGRMHGTIVAWPQAWLHQLPNVSRCILKFRVLASLAYEDQLMK